jgi:hypothetical protein
MRKGAFLCAVGSGLSQKTSTTFGNVQADAATAALESSILAFGDLWLARLLRHDYLRRQRRKVLVRLAASGVFVVITIGFVIRSAHF